MKIVEEYLLALRVLGYTDCEARFLYLAATHSGYFVPRQFNTFADVNWGNRSDRFTRKLETRGYATWREYLGIGSVYHLCAKDLYTRIGKEDLRHHRVHSIEFITARLFSSISSSRTNNTTTLKPRTKSSRISRKPLAFQRSLFPPRLTLGRLFPVHRCGTLPISSRYSWMGPATARTRP
jgi:hypothetical protein